MNTEQRIDPRAVKPFNEWWRTYAAGFKAGLKVGVDGAIAVLNGEKT